MKKQQMCAMVIGALAWAGAAAGAVYTDAATNYPGGSWTNGSNGGEGFGPWSIVADAQGGWAGAGIWDSAGAGLMMGEAFGYVGKVGYVQIDRAFAQGLNTNDVFALDFGVNWDSDIGNKGFSLFAAGTEVINVNHGGFPGEIKLNGTNALVNYGTNTMRWTFTQLAGNQIGVAATGRDGVETFATTVTTAGAYGYLGAVRFYSSGLAADAPDQRQSYFDNLTLEQEGTPPPDPTRLVFTSGTWNPVATGDYSYLLERSGEVGAEIELTSSNTNTLQVTNSLSFSGTNTVLEVVATVASLASGPATLVASNAASGAWAEYVVTPVAPALQITGAAIQISGGVKNYTLTRSASTGTNVFFTSSDPGVLTVPVDLIFGAGAFETTFPVTFTGYGTATITASNPATGAWTTFEATYQAPKLTLLGLRRSWVGGTEAYRVTREGAVGDTVNLASSNPGVMTSAQASVTFAAGENTAYFNADAVGEGTTTWTASNDDATSEGLGVEVAAAPDFGAYDDASLYAAWSLAPAHDSGFPAWTETLSPEAAGSFRGSFIGTALIPGINVGGASFGLYANYSGAAPDPLPEARLARAFPAPMSTGQVFSVDVGYNWNSGTKGFKLKGDFEGTAYDRFELFNSGNDTWSYKFDGNDATIAVAWNGYIAGGFVGRVQVTCTAPNTFTFSFLREGEAAPTLVADVVLPGGIDQVEFYNYNGGSGDAENFTFNRLWLTAGSAEAPRPPIDSLAFNGGNPQFTVPGGYALSRVQGADCALVGGDWAWSNLVEGVHYTVAADQVTLVSSNFPRQVVRIGVTAE